MHYNDEVHVLQKVMASLNKLEDDLLISTQEDEKTKKVRDDMIEVVEVAKKASRGVYWEHKEDQ